MCAAHLSLYFSGKIVTMKLISSKGAVSGLLKRTGKLGKKIVDIALGDKLHLTETIEDKDLLLYLGLTNDNNPLYIQHDYAARTPFEKPIVPTTMLSGIINAAISKHLPGPGSHIVEQQLKFLAPVFHYETVDFLLEVEKVNVQKNEIEIIVQAFDTRRKPVIEGKIIVSPPYIASL